MADTVNNPIPLVPENTIDPAAGLNLALNAIDAMLQVAVQSVGLNTPPVSPVDGARYIVGTAPTGLWVGRAGQLARWEQVQWKFYTARYVLNLADNQLYARGSANAWVAIGGGGGGGSSAQYIGLACSDLTTDIVAGNTRAYFDAPFAMNVTEVRATLLVAQASGSIFTVDINVEGSSILATKLTIDNGEVSSATAATPPVISQGALAKNARITVDIDQIGTAGARGLIVTLIGVVA